MNWFIFEIEVEQKGLACLKQESSRPKTVQAQFDQTKCEALRALLHQGPRTFGKAFRKTYGYSLEKYRLHGWGQIPTKVDLFLLAQYRLRGAIVVEPQIVTKPAFKVAGYELKTTTRDDVSNQEVPAFWDSMTAERFDTLHNKPHSVSEAELGLSFPTDSANGDFISSLFASTSECVICQHLCPRQ